MIKNINPKKVFWALFSIFTVLASTTGSYAAMDYSDVEEIASNLQKGITALGVFIGVFLVPYAVILMATGSQENIKKGKDWLTSYVSGLIVILLAGIIIKIVGTELLRL